MVFSVFGSRDLPWDPQEAQEPPKKHPKSSKGPKKIAPKNHKKCLRGKNCLKPAISFLVAFGPPVWYNCLLIFKLILYIFFYNFLKSVETHFGTQFGIRAAQEGQDEPIRTIRSFKEQKTFIYKNLKKTNCFLKVFGCRGLSRKPQDAQDGSQKAPTKSKTPKNRNPKSNPKIIKNENQFFGAHSKTKHSQNQPEKNSI